MPYKNNHERQSYIKEYKLQRIERYRQLVGDISERYGCQVCLERDRVVLDFHHYDPTTKKFGIGDAVVKCLSWKKIIEEIKKCVVLCANCHRKTHAGKLVICEDMKCSDVC